MSASGRIWFRATTIIAVGLLPSLTGCQRVSRWVVDPWLTDYDSAERRAQEAGKPILVVYRDGRDKVDRPFLKALRKVERPEHLQYAIRCTIYRPFEPDRRYAAQFGVERSPGLIVVHADGTHHAVAGPLSESQIADFLSGARPPGESRERNALVPRSIRYEWHDTLGGAEAKAGETSKPILIVLYRLFTTDWQRLSSLLEKPEVFRVARDMVHCRVGVWNPMAKAYTGRWGKVNLPAIVVERPDGSHAVLEMPTGNEAIARFIDRALESEISASRVEPSALTPSD